MAFGLKYYAECLDRYGNLIRCEILGKDYAGAVSEMELTGDAIKLSRTNKDITEQICGMGVKISVWCNTEGQYLDLFATSDRDHMVVVYRAGRVVFRGFVSPELYAADFIAPPYEIVIPATDGLAALTDYAPEVDYTQERILLLDIIRRCLAQTELNLPIAINCSIFPDGHEDSAGTLFEKVYADTETMRVAGSGKWNENDAHLLLSDALKSFGCRIYQDDDMWYIDRVKNRCDDSWPWIVYAPDGGKTKVQRYETVNIDTDNVWYVDNPASVEMDSGYGRQTITIDYTKSESVVPENFDKGVRVAPEYFDGRKSPLVSENRRWVKNSTGLTLTEFWGESGQIGHGVRFGITYNNGIPIRAVDSFGLKSILSVDHAGKINISFKTNHSVTGDITGWTSHLKFAFGMRWVDLPENEPWWLQSSGTGYSWKRSNDIHWVPVNYNSRDGERDVDITTSSFEAIDREYDVFFAITYPYPTTGHRGEFSRSISVGDIRITASEVKEYDNTFEAQVNYRYRRKAPDLSMRFSDLPSLSRGLPNRNYTNGLSVGLGPFDSTYAWRDVQEDEGSNKLYERLLIDNFDQYYDPREKFSGDILTDQYLTPRNLYRVNGRDKYYMLTGLDYIMATGIYRAQIEEIKKRQVEIGNE